jgi:hypothetical protein
MEKVGTYKGTIMKKHLTLLSDIAYGIAAAVVVPVVIMAFIVAYFGVTPSSRGLVDVIPDVSSLPLFVGLETGGEALFVFTYLMIWLVAIFMWRLLARWIPRIAYFMQLTSVLGMMLLPVLGYVSAWRLFGFSMGGGLAYGSIPVAHTHAVWLFVFPAMTLICIAWGLQSRDRAITHGGVFALGAGIIMTVLGMSLR